MTGEEAWWPQWEIGDMQEHQANDILRTVGAKFLTNKGIKNRKTEKIRKNPVVLDLNQRCQCELVFNI